MSLEYLASKTVEHAMKQSGKTPKPMGWHSVFAFVGAILLIIGIALIVAPAAVELDTNDFVNDGKTAVGTITKLENRKVPLGYRGLNKRDEYWVHVLYVTNESAKILASSFRDSSTEHSGFETAQTNLVQKETFDALKNEDSIDIVYLPNNPERIILLSELDFYRSEKTKGPPIDGILLLVGGVGGIIMYLLLDRRKKKQLNLT